MQKNNLIVKQTCEVGTMSVAVTNNGIAIKDLRIAECEAGVWKDIQEIDLNLLAYLFI